VKILLDEMLDAVIAERLRQRGHDAVAVQGNPDLQGKKDPELLQAAHALGRVLVTDNIQDFARLHQLLAATGQEHAEIILVSPATFPRAKGTIRKWVDGLDRYLREHGKTSLENLCTWLS
jgi:predicted nuclease of predicted toxin-antitoxin system